MQFVGEKGWLDRFTFWNVILGLATAIGAFGGMPEPVGAFKWLAEWKIFQWVLVFVLVYQGGGGEDVFFSATITLIVLIVYIFFRLFDKDEPKEEFRY